MAVEQYTTPPVTERPTTEVGYATLLPPAALPSWTAYLDLDPDEEPQLAWPMGIHVWHRMRSDSQIASLLDAVFLPIRRWRWGINPNGARDEIVAAVAADLGLPILGSDEDVTRGRVRFNHDDHLRHALLGLVYGAMWFEQVGVIDGTGAAARWRLRKLAPRMPQSVMSIKVAPDGGLEGIVQYSGGIGPWAPSQGQSRGPAGPMGTGVPIDIGRLVAYSWQREGARWSGLSILRACYRNWVVKDRLIRVDAGKHERFGMGVPVAKAPQGADAKVVARHGALAQSVTAGPNGGAGLAYGADLEIKGVSGGLPDTVASLRWHDEQMTRRFLQMFQYLGTTSTGTRALGESFLDFFKLSQEAVGHWYADTTNEHVIEDWVDWNYGPDEQAPLLSWETREDQTTLAVADLVDLVTNGILHVDEELESWIRNMWFGGLQQGAVITPPPIPTPAQPAAARRRDRVRAGGTPRRRHVHAQSSQTYRDTGIGHRPPTLAETASGADFEAIQQTWKDALASFLDDWRGVRTAQIDQLAAAVEAAAANGDIAALANIGIPPAGVDLAATHLARMVEDAIVAARSEASAQGVTVGLVSGDVYASAVKAQANALAYLTSRDLSAAAARQAVQRYGAANLAAADVAAGVKDHLSALSDAYLEDTLGGALTIAQNTGRAAVFDLLPEDQTSYLASELLDQATCDACFSVDGTEYSTLEDALNDYPSGGYLDCDGGPRCRGTIVAIIGESPPSDAGTG